MSKDARERIEEYFRAEGAGEPEELFRFRLSGRTRLWGVRDRAVFQLLWQTSTTRSTRCPGTEGTLGKPALLAPVSLGLP